MVAKSGHAAVGQVALLDAGAILAVVAERILRRMHARLGRLVAGIGRAGPRVGAVRGRPGLADAALALLLAVAEDPVVADAGVPGAIDACRAGALHDVAELPIGALGVVRRVGAGLGSLVAVVRAGDVVRGARERPRHASLRADITLLDAVAEERVRALGIVRREHAPRDIIARIVGARDVVAAHRRLAVSRTRTTRRTSPRRCSTCCHRTWCHRE